MFLDDLFPPQRGQRVRIAGNVFGQEFECNESMKARVLGLIDHAHAAAPEFLDDAVVRDRLPHKLGVGRH